MPDSRPRRPKRSRSSNKLAGSEGRQSNSSEPDFLIVGQIVRPHGIRGEIGMKSLTDYPEHLVELRTLYIGDEYAPLTVSRIRRHSAGFIIQFDGILDREAAEDLRGETVYISINDATPLADGEYYIYQLQGIRVVTDTGQELGHLVNFLETGANDVYVVSDGSGREILLPVIPDVIQSVDLEARVMVVHLLDGLI
jgi:16S rRNA processing protein RimM